MGEFEKFSIFCHRKSGIRVSPNEGMQTIKKILLLLQNQLPELFIDETINVQTFSKKHKSWIKSDLSDFDTVLAPIIKRLLQRDYKSKKLDFDPDVKAPLGFTQGFVNYWGKENLDDRVSIRITQGFNGYVKNTVRIKFNPLYYKRLSKLEEIKALFAVLIKFWRPEQLFIAPLSLRMLLGEKYQDGFPSIGWVTWFPDNHDALKSIDDFIVQSFEGGTLLALSEVAEFVPTKKQVELIQQLRAQLAQY